MNLSVHELPPLIGTVLLPAVAVFVLSQKPRDLVARLYLALGVSFALWNFGTFWMFRVPSEESAQEQAFFWARFLQFGVVFLLVLMNHIALLVANVNLRRVRRLVYAIYIIHALLALSNFGHFFIKGVKNVGYAWYSVAGTGFWIWSCFFPLLPLSIYLLHRARTRLPPLHRKRLTPLMLAQGMFAFSACNDILPILEIYRYPFSQVAIYPIGNLMAILYGLFIGYSVLQHQLLDIQVALSHIAAKVVRMSFLFFVSALVLMVAALCAPADSPFSPYTFGTGLIALLIGAITASVLFPKLFGGAAETLERSILGDRFEYHERVRAFIESMQWYSDSSQLLSDLDKLLVKNMQVKHYEIISVDETSRAFALLRSYPELPAQQFPELHHESPIFVACREGGLDYLALSPAYNPERDDAVARAAREQLQKFRAEFCFPFFSDDEPFGLLLLGEKSSGEPYTITDLHLMVALVKSLSLMINQIRLKNQIMHAQELELLGRMSRGMAHDLNNLLTPVWTFLQLASEGVSTEDLSEDLLPVALRNITTMRSYIREALFYSENLRPDFQLGRLDVVVNAAVETVRSKLERNRTNVKLDIATEVLAEMDEVLIQRTIANIISNAIDASPTQSTIRVELMRLIKTEASREWLRIRVIDSGEGIKPEDLNRIFTPYFTTKDRGDKDRGFGLGLAICRKIIHLHSGNLNVSSQVGRGTIVQIDLPNRQAKPTATPAAATAT